MSSRDVGRLTMRRGMGTPASMSFRLIQPVRLQLPDRIVACHHSLERGSSGCFFRSRSREGSPTARAMGARAT